MILYDIVEMGQTDFVITLWFNNKPILLCDNVIVPMWPQRDVTKQLKHSN